VLRIAGIDKEHSKAAGVEKLVDRNPVDAGRFHRDGLDAAFCKPNCQPMQIGRESSETADLTAAINKVDPTSMAA
jgi:hypothetical protein